MRPINGILWDNDGLLVDTERLYFEANRQALQEVGVELMRSQFVEISLRQGLSLLELARKHLSSDEAMRQLRARRDALYLKRLQKGVPILPDVEWTLSKLYGRMRMGIVTSAQRVHFDAMHASTGLLRYFDFALTLGDYRHSKPDPSPYLEGLHRLRLSPSNVMAVEDSERGLQSALAAGLRCAVVPNADTRGGNFSRAAVVLQSLSQLLRVMDL